MFILSKQSIIYTLCPAYSRTGGPEAIHQLTDALRSAGHDARIVSVPMIPDPRQLEYADYNCRYSREIHDRPEHVLIVPETMPRLLDRYGHIQKAIWWLSVDNHFKHAEDRQFDWNNKANSDVRHFAQSYYALDFLARKGVAHAALLTDYLGRNFCESNTSPPKKNRVAFLAKKNRGVLDPVLAAAPDIDWVPIENMSSVEVANHLCSCKVYLDFGPHPGRDRMPREAALSGCCVLVGLRGAATFSGDYPFPDAYKFDVNESQTGKVVERIRSCFERYELEYQAFEGYRAWICRQSDDFQEQVRRVFGVQKECPRSVRNLRFINHFRFYQDKILKKLLRRKTKEFS